MKRKSLQIRAGLAVITMVMPAAADTIYSNLQDIAIPTGSTFAAFDGVFIDLDASTPVVAESSGTWDINPFFGGVGVANSPNFQPTRTGTSNLASLQDVAAGNTISGDVGLGLNFATGYGGSSTHVGTTFTAGSEEYLGFKLGSNYGWMRVVFTANTSGSVTPVIKDWAYDNSGGTGAIVVGRVNQVATDASHALTSLTPQGSESFTLASALTDNAINTVAHTNRVEKSGDGTVVLSGVNTYSGSTTVKAGTLALGETGTIAASTSIVVGDAASTGAVLDTTAKAGFTIGSTQTLSGIGEVNVGSANTLTIEGTHAVGNAGTDGGVGTQKVTGNLSYAASSIFNWDINANSTVSGFDTVATTGTVEVSTTGTVFNVVFRDGVNLDNHFWMKQYNLTQSWSIASIFGSSFTSGTFATVTSTGANPDTQGYFTINDTYLTWNAVPEPTSALAGLLLAAGLLRRRRK